MIEELDFSYAKALNIGLAPHNYLHIRLVGCGGTGSWLLPHLARLVRAIRNSGRSVTLTLIDPDRIEPHNILRQNFQPTDIGQYKAAVLALRYGTMTGLEINFVPSRFEAEMVGREHNALTLLIGCVDNAAARQELNRTLARPVYFNSYPRIWWLDAGNSIQSGQILLGNSCRSEQLLQHPYNASSELRYYLPSPALQHSELLIARPEELIPDRPDCARMQIANVQGFTINQAMASIVADYAFRLVGIGQLKRFATYLDLPSGTARSRYITPAELETFKP